MCKHVYEQAIVHRHPTETSVVLSWTTLLKKIALIRPFLDAGICIGQAKVLELSCVLGNFPRDLDPASMSW